MSNKNKLKRDHISDATIRRIPRYYRHMEHLQQNFVDRTSSKELAQYADLTPSLVRQDFSCFGGFGQLGYGYKVDTLMEGLADVLGMNNGYHAVILGADQLGSFLASTFPFQRYGIQITGLYDVKPTLIGTKIHNIPVYSIEQLPFHLEVCPVDIAILTCSDEAASSLLATLSHTSIQGIWNFTNVEYPKKYNSIFIENIHLFDSLFSLCCTMNHFSYDKDPAVSPCG